MIEGVWRRDPFEVRTFPADMSLRFVTKKVEAFDDPGAPEVEQELRQLVVGMGTALFAHSGVGLAAPQVGVNRRVFVMRDPEHVPNPPGVKAKSPVAVFAFFNPRIVEEEGEEDGEEGCLSLPGLRASVVRATRVLVEHESQFGETMEVEAVGWEARVIQHEIDHLDGVLITDHLSPADRLRAFVELEALANQAREEEHRRMQQMIASLTAAQSA